MPEMTTSELERRALETLERKKNAQHNHDTTQNEQPSESPRPEEPRASIGSIQNQGTAPEDDDYEIVPPPPSNEDVAKMGGTTSDNVAPKAPANEDDGAILVGNAKATPTLPITEEEETLILTSTAKERLGNVPPADRDNFIAGILPTIASYKKDLIINQGMTAEEAMKAATNRMKRSANEYAENWAKEHPEGVVLTIDKSQEKDLQLDDEIQTKMRRSKLVNLVEIEDKELATLRIKKVKPDTKMSNIRDLFGSVSNFSVPLLGRGDYAYFSGAQTSALANATSNPDDTPLDNLEKKASLIYHCFMGAVVQSKKKPDGSVMTYDEFCNWFKFTDLNIALYAIAVASSMEDCETMYVCQNQQCRRTFNISYNVKTLLDLSRIPDTFKTRLKEIDEHRSDFEWMQKLSKSCDEITRYRSPFSKNIFDMGNPSIAEARARLASVERSERPDDAVVAAINVYVDEMGLYDRSDDSYIMVDSNEEPDLAYSTICDLHNVDVELLGKAVAERQYVPEFFVKTKCPHCGREATDPLDIDALLFLLARASFTAIS